MRLGAYDFTPRPVPTLAAAVMLALLLALGRWQVMRAQEKQARQALFEERMRAVPLSLASRLADPESVIFRRVRGEGRYLASAQIFIDNRQHEGRAGFHVITPLQLEANAGTVLVNRGWVARTADYPKAPVVPVPEGAVAIAGVASTPPARVLELSPNVVNGNVWQNLSIAKYREHMRVDVLPFVVLSAAPEPGLVAVEEKPDTGVAEHQEYALTWFSLAVTVAALWIGLNLRRRG